MTKKTKQIEKWTTDFGKEYTDRNILNIEEMDELYTKNFGITRTDLNKRFVGDLDRSIKILEVGSNVGNQLLNLQNMGFKNIYGIEVNGYAVEVSKKRSASINIIQGSAFDLPFKDGYFDMVFTSGVLIHIGPDEIGQAISEIHRCTKDYVWGWEYYADEYTEVEYRGNKDLMWKTNFPELYLEAFSGTDIIKEERVKYLDSDDEDIMYLIRKKQKF